MPLINIVYPHTHLTGHAEHKGDFTVILSAFPVDDCDMYVYQDAFSYFGERPGLEVLLMLEPYVVLPGEYREDVWHYFDYILTFVDGLAERGRKFRKINFPVLPVYDERNTGKLINPFRSIPPEAKKNAICLINGNKYSNIEGELYSKRKDIALWFHEHSNFQCDVFGYPPFDLPNYKGAVQDKYSVLAQYKFSICFENVYHPVWSRGYISEKLLDCFMAETVPIYLGCYNIEEYVPTDLFIDFRQFRDYAELDDFLRSLSQDDYRLHIEKIRKWVEGGGLDDYTVYRLYDQLISIFVAEFREKNPSSVWQPGVSPRYQRKKWVFLKGRPIWPWDSLCALETPKVAA